MTVTDGIARIVKSPRMRRQGFAPRSSACEGLTMTKAGRMTGCAAATLIVLLMAAIAPAKAQIAGLGGDGGGGQDMMTQMAPMLNMMKAKMGKRRFGALMQTMGPMMGNMMQGGGALGGSGFGGLGGSSVIGPGLPAFASGGFAGGSDITSMLGGAGGGEMMTMIPQLVSLAGTGGGRHHRRHRPH
jgi:hypothetical protein